ncbi:hypothetical protein TraAM80_02516 [Trypanosoma rangeli]|uniref:Uncharacterized protein n=1 Tax=Trypanosoma rangeli TaxID=5698 RepID=A0A422NUF3_TRYRA|nr:uncharacterized protein TraAM80_02516 [Trypanosoma rangeli]RNF09084.1 hypothetical protein TraAM80_02516 [Trypanosoma rangeli]|eukprot:RNF09084.1 hypothetical protein TraAM80_02516 [Trypanosoma rangeli]
MLKGRNAKREVGVQISFTSGNLSSNSLQRCGVSVSALLPVALLPAPDRHQVKVDRLPVSALAPGARVQGPMTATASGGEQEESQHGCGSGDWDALRMRGGSTRSAMSEK